MRLDPLTTLNSLLLAIPSSALAFERLGVATHGNESKTLQEICADKGISMDEFHREMDGLDWTRESPTIEDSARS